MNFSLVISYIFPSSPINLIPLSSIKLCEAVIYIPKDLAYLAAIPIYIPIRNEIYNNYSALTLNPAVPYFIIGKLFYFE